MNDIAEVAKGLHMNPDDLIKESVKTYLYQRLSRVESELFLLAKKYGVKDVFELDGKVKEGLINEKDAYDDYFAFDNLEADREIIKKLLEEI
ncbi:MAG TPA: hypothetical protein DCY12_03125 [Candidatus Atribacteria bacterium]|nr:hypothetical protein [Candidatus Atribacteria bacterium]